MGRARKKTVLVNEPDKLPQPWLVDSEWLLTELARLRELILRIPVSNKSVLPANTAIDAIWRTEQQLRYLLHLHKEGQQAFAQKSAVQDERQTSSPKALRSAAS